jgi:hypothetical protein
VGARFRASATPKDNDRVRGAVSTDVCRRVLVCAAFFSIQACQRRDAAPTSDTVPPRQGATTSVTGSTCGVDQRTALTGDGIGGLRVGARVEDVARTCRVLRDTTGLGIEGQQERTILVDLGRDSVAAVVSAGRVWRVHVQRPAFRTTDSLGIGTPVGAFRHRGPEVLMGEGNVFLRLPSHCGLSFRLRDVVAGRASSLEQLPDSVAVDEVLAIGCGGPGRVVRR